MIEVIRVALSKCWVGMAAAALAVPVWAQESPSQAKDSQAAQLLELSGVQGGFVVHVGVGDGRLTAALRASNSFQVQGLDRDADVVAKARKRLQDLGLYGDVSIDRWESEQLPYVDNLVNLLVGEHMGAVGLEEVMRVLVPDGVALLKQPDGQWKKTVKPRPANIDDWSHYLHDASGNAVAHDEVVAPPRHLQWVGSPRYSRHHDRMASMSALVSTAGRMFYIMDEGSRISIQLPSKWKLIARDAFNGTVLWKRDIPTWQNHLWPLKSGPTQLSRRLIADGQTVYVTLGYDAPLEALDAATGKTLRTYEGSEGTEEVISIGKKLFLVVRKGKAELADYAPVHGRVGDQALARDLFWNEEPRLLMAFDAESGKRLWAKQTKISPLTLSADTRHLYFHDGERIVAAHQQSGQSAWQSEEVSRRNQFNFNFGPRLLVHQDVVLFAGGDNKMFSLSIDDGKTLWTAAHPNSGYQSPQDLMVVDGLVWCAPTTSGKDSGVFTGRDPKTGEIKKEFPPNIDTYWFHHRCYIAKATDRFLIPSRTGVEFVNPAKEDWDIHHWVRGGCLYGVMPCNGLTYTPPHDCACYPEAKLFGFNALAPLAPTRPVPREVSEAGRLTTGPAHADALQDKASGQGDWPTFRHDASRSGTALVLVPSKVSIRWNMPLKGRLTSPVIAAGQVYVAAIDQHTLHAMDELSGQSKWTFTAGGRIDSPPTVSHGRVVFGCADGSVYCLRASDGQLAWKFRAAPLDRRTMAFEQLESLWPVHGSVLIRDKTIYCVAGRSNFLDGGLRLLRLDLASGRKISETVMDEKNPATGNNLQETLKILQMPVGLPDILSADDKFLYMKSQKFDFEGNRLQIGPHSGDFVEQASVQRGEGEHIFAPMGFLDDSWFHRSYWVLGQSFAGGHGGYYQAGRFAPSGQILVKGNGYVFGYGRKPEYLRWTTTMEHQLFAADPTPPEFDRDKLVAANRARGQQTVVGAAFPKSPSLDPTGKPITIEAWVTSTNRNGVILARGGPAEGYALILDDGKPSFLVRSGGTLSRVTAARGIVGGWHHVAAVLTEDKELRLFVDGKRAGKASGNGLLTKDPAQGLDIGSDSASSVGDYESPNVFTGIIDEVRMYFAAATDVQIADRFETGSELMPDPKLVVTFDDGTARDFSTYRNDGTLEGAAEAEGKFGKAIRLTRRQGNADAQIPGNSLVKPKWAFDIPIYVRAMVLAGDKLFVAGPLDIIDEEETFKQLTQRDEDVQKLLARQDDALEGKIGGKLLSIHAPTGQVENTLDLGTLPAWDGMASANGRLFLSTQDGRVLCIGN